MNDYIGSGVTFFTSEFSLNFGILRAIEVNSLIDCFEY